MKGVRQRTHKKNYHLMESINNKIDVFLVEIKFIISKA